MRGRLCIVLLGSVISLGCTGGGGPVAPADQSPLQRWLTVRTQAAGSRLGFQLEIDLDSRIARLWHDGVVQQELPIEETPLAVAD